MARGEARERALPILASPRDLSLAHLGFCRSPASKLPAVHYRPVHLSLRHLDAGDRRRMAGSAAHEFAIRGRPGYRLGIAADPAVHPPRRGDSRSGEPAAVYPRPAKLDADPGTHP